MLRTTLPPVLISICEKWLHNIHTLSVKFVYISELTDLVEGDNLFWPSSPKNRRVGKRNWSIKSTTGGRSCSF